MHVTRSRHGLALVTTAALLASLTAATVATPASAAKPKCRGQVATIVGTKKADRLVGTNRRDVIVARGGNDIVIGRGGNDLICGGPGADRLVGQGGLDLLFGNGGPDRLFGGDGPDRLYGGVGDDVVAGQVGPDRLNGGPGTDTCYQGQGAGPHVSCELPAAAPPPPSPAPTPTPTPDPGPQPISLDDILAVAYSDIDGLDGYSTGDVMIALLRDKDGDDYPSDGDMIEMGQYPTSIDPGPSDFADWDVKSHTMDGPALGVSTHAISVADSTGNEFSWYEASDANVDEYFEEAPGGASTDIGDRKDTQNDFIFPNANSPSAPTDEGTQNAPGTGDDRFLDIEIDYVTP